ncbi:MAG: serine/threonine-protein kinase, partial [Marmoricola sp.]
MQPELIGDRYRVEAAIGQGGMGTVWLCRDERLHRVVAVKQVGLLPGESVTDSARALREARSSAALSHPNVVTIYDVVEDSGHLWLVMEHVPGRSLSEVIKQDGPLDPATVADIGAQIAGGLAALHAAGTTHRDVKPGNVLIRGDGVAKISDFGISRTTGDQTLTGAGLVTGTPSYFSPELARGSEPSPADDVWALGATLYAAVEGHPPYANRTNPVAVLHDIVTGPPPPPQRAEFLEPALTRMLDRDPESRWAMTDVGHVLGRLAETHRSDATIVETRAAAIATESTAAFAA